MIKKTLIFEEKVNLKKFIFFWHGVLTIFSDYATYILHTKLTKKLFNYVTIPLQVPVITRETIETTPESLIIVVSGSQLQSLPRWAAHNVNIVQIIENIF